MRDANWEPPPGWTPSDVASGGGGDPLIREGEALPPHVRPASCISIDYGVETERIRAGDLRAFADRHGARVVDLITTRELFDEEMETQLGLDPDRPATPIPPKDVHGPLSHGYPHRRYFLR